MIYRQDIDGMRALAIIAVVLYHAFPKIFPGGFIGVDIFFVISGYLIIGKLLTNPVSLKSFYIGRIKRILPCLVMVLATFMSLGYFFLYAQEYQNLSRHVMASLLFSNHWLLIQEMGYFDKLGDFKPFLHLWSLSIEEQFYLFLPVLAFIFYRNKWSIRLVLTCLLVASLVYDLSSTIKGVDTYYSPCCRFWEFALGGFLVYSPWLKRDFSWLAVCLIMLAIFLLRPNQDLLVFKLMVCLLTAFLVMQPGSANHHLFQHKLLVYIGLISYPLYLWHWSFLSFFRVIAGGGLSVELTIGLIVISVLVSMLTYHFIDFPIRQSSRQTLIVWVCLLSFMMLSVVASVIDIEHGLLNRPINIKRQQMLQDLMSFDDYKKNLVNCHINGVDICLQNKSQSPSYVVWGDSHAEHLFPGLLNKLPNKSGMLISTHSCPPLIGVQAHWQGEPESCLQTNASILRFLKDLPSAKVVILSAVGSFYISTALSSEQLIQDFSPAYFQLQLGQTKHLDKAQVFLKGMQQTIDDLQTLGKTVLVLEDTPLLPIMPVNCLTRPLQKPQPFCQLPLKEVQAIQQDYHKLLVQLKSDNPQVLFYGAMDALCHHQHCPIIEKGHFLYRDSQHLSLAGSELLAKGLLANFPHLQDTSF